MTTNLKTPQDSQPLVLVVENKTDQWIENIELFDALRNAWKNIYHHKDGRLDNENFSIDSSIPGISYQDMLLGIATGTSFVFGFLLVSYNSFFSFNKGKEEIQFSLSSYDLLGNKVRVCFKAEWSPKQIENNTMAYSGQFCVDKQTSVKILTMPPKEKFTIFLYPSVIEKGNF